MSDPYEHDVYFLHNFMERFVRDLEGAKARVLLQSPFLKPRRVELLREALKVCTKRYVRVCVFAERPEVVDSLFEDAFRLLISTGAHVTLRPGIHEKLAVIDEVIAWDGSLNALSFRNKSERMTRWLSRRKADEIIASHRLDTCQVCADELLGRNQREHMGASLARRRIELGMTQRDLAEMSGVRQTQISQIERGVRDIRMSTLDRIHDALGMGFRSLPKYVLPSVDSFSRRRW